MCCRDFRALVLFRTPCNAADRAGAGVDHTESDGLVGHAVAHEWQQRGKPHSSRPAAARAIFAERCSYYAFSRRQQCNAAYRVECGRGY